VFLIDTHCHLDIELFDFDRERLVDRCREKGVNGFVLPGVTQAGWTRLQRIGDGFDRFYLAPGLHPCFTDQHEERHLVELEAMIHNSPGKVVGIGEVGLDFFEKEPDRAQQYTFFEAQVEMAAENRLPLLLHVRKAHDEALKVLRRSGHRCGGIVHCYSGSLHQAERYLDAGFKLGIGGVITYDNAHRLRNIASSLPLTAFVLETDAPDIPPAGLRGGRNTPENLPLIFDSFCRVRGEPREVIEQALYRNTMVLFPGMEV